MVLSFWPATVSGRQLFAVQVSHIDGNLLCSRQHVDNQGRPEDPLFGQLIGKIIDDLAGHFAAFRISPGLKDYFSTRPGFSSRFALLEDYAIYAFRKYELTLEDAWYQRANQCLMDAEGRGSAYLLVLAKIALFEMDKYVFWLRLTG